MMKIIQLTNTITKKDKGNQQVLDKLKVERERGITGAFPLLNGNSTDVYAKPSQGPNGQVASLSLKLLASVLTRPHTQHVPSER